MDPKIIDKVRNLMKEYDTDKADVFDLDGTVIDGNILTSSVTSLYTKFTSKSPHIVTHLEQFSIRQETIARTEMTKSKTIRLAEAGLFHGCAVGDVQELIYSNLEQIIHSCFKFPRALILALRRRRPRRIIICITGTPQDFIDILGPLLGFDVAIGTVYPKRNKIFVPGEKDLDAGLRKGNIMDILNKKCGVKFDESTAIGNDRYDYPMFTRVRYPIAFNPEPALQKIVRETQNTQWQAGAIPWVHQKHGNDASDLFVWLPNSDGMLQETNLEAILPPGITQVIQTIEKEWSLKCFSR